MPRGGSWSPNANASRGAFPTRNEIPQSLLPVPGSFNCPILHDIMADPVSTCDGHTFERSAITVWLQNHNTSPITNEPLPDKRLTPNHALVSAINAYVQSRPEVTAPGYNGELSARDVELAVQLHE